MAVNIPKTIGYQNNTLGSQHKNIGQQKDAAVTAGYSSQTNVFACFCFVFYSVSVACFAPKSASACPIRMCPKKRVLEGPENSPSHAYRGPGAFGEILQNTLFEFENNARETNRR